MLTDKQWDRMSFAMYVVYHKFMMADGREIFVPSVDVHGQAIAYPTRKAAAPEVYRMRELYGQRRTKVIKVGPIR
jgi:hypothetical protein